MTAIDLIAKALEYQEPPETPVEGICCVTGIMCPTINRRHVIKPSFTRRDLLHCPTSDRAGVSAWLVLGHKWERMSSWTCDGLEFVRLNRVGVREKVLQEADTERQTANYATTSYKKHGALLAPVAQAGKRVWLFEERIVDCSDRNLVQSIWGRLRTAQDAGIVRPLIESLDISPGYMGKIGWRLWQDFERWARPLMRSPLYQFLTYLLPSKEELRNADN